MPTSRIPCGVLVLSPFLWLALVLVLLIFAVPGVPIVLVLALARVARPQPSRYFACDVMQFPSLFWPWCNLEDGADGPMGRDPGRWGWRAAGWRAFITSALLNQLKRVAA